MILSLWHFTTLAELSLGQGKVLSAEEDTKLNENEFNITN